MRSAPPRPDIAWSFVWLALIWGVALFAQGDRASTVAMGVAAAFVPYGALLWRAPIFSRRRLLWLVAFAGLPLIASEVTLSDDVYRFLWDGHVSGKGQDPYAYAPSSPALAAYRDAYWPLINNATVPTIYPPLAQLYFLVAASLSRHPAAFKALALAAHLALAAWLHRRSPRAALTFALNPLALSESALSGHVDILVGAFVVMMAVHLAARRTWRAAAFAVAAVATKLVGVLFLPFLWVQRKLGAVVALPLMLLCILPLASAGYGDGHVPGLSHYAGRWQGNSGLYRVVESGIRRGLESGWGTAAGRIEMPEFEDALQALEGTPLDPWRAYEREKKPVGARSAMATHILSAWLARLGLLVALGFLSILLARRVQRGADVLMSARLLLLCALLFAPQLHPWYLLWLLPLEALTGRKAVLIWSAAALVGYFPLDRWASSRVWMESELFVALEYGLVLLAIGFDWTPSGGENSKSGLDLASGRKPGPKNATPKELPPRTLVSG